MQTEFKIVPLRSEYHSTNVWVEFEIDNHKYLIKSDFDCFDRVVILASLLVNKLLSERNRTGNDKWTIKFKWLFAIFDSSKNKNNIAFELSIWYWNYTM